MLFVFDEGFVKFGGPDKMFKRNILRQNSIAWSFFVEFQMPHICFIRALRPMQCHSVM